MGVQKVSSVQNKTSMQKFVRTLLRDVQAMEYMLEKDWFEKDIVRIGAEQEIFLVDKQTMKPAPINLDILAKMSQYNWLKPELAKFNLETNLIPREFKDNCLREMEMEGIDYLQKIRKIAASFNVDVALVGILPSLHRNDMEMHNLTPNARYKEILDITKAQLNGNSFSFHIEGIDELRLKQESALLPACSTSYQVHLQVSPTDFAKFYNIAQLVAGPMLAISANASLVFGKRLWHESRMSLYRQSSDTRIPGQFMRQESARVNFGDDWIQHSVMDLYREDISRFRVLLGGVVEEDALDMIKAGKVPNLKALQIHNSTVYRWNRPCYGISPNGQPHLRIENRMLSAGPTVVDEMANTAFWLGLMIGIANEYEDIKKRISFADVKDNFGKAARYGIHSELNWLGGQKKPAKQLITKVLLPIARAGLRSRAINEEDIDRYLSIIEQRAKKQLNGASWMVKAYERLNTQFNKQKALATLTASMVQQQWTHQPVHTWSMPKLDDLADYHPSELHVEVFMNTKFRTVRKEDVIELAYEIMQWETIDYLPVEDKHGYLVGLLPMEQVATYFDKKGNYLTKEITLVEQVMLKTPLTIVPNISLMETMCLMSEYNLKYLPVVNNGQLVGTITKKDCQHIIQHLLEQPICENL